MKKLITGVVIGLLLPFIMDWLLFGTLTPCETITTGTSGYEMAGEIVLNISE